MKRIHKKPEPEGLRQWKKNYRRQKDGASLEDLYQKENMTGKYLWNRLGSKGYSKKVLREELLEEQGYLCCYCNRQIELEGSSIEHFLPKSKSVYFEQIFDYSNLHAACSGKAKPVEPPKNETICDKHKGEELIPLSPLQEDIEKHFEYTLGGQVKPKSTAAERTVSILHLNASKLIKLRQAVLEAYIYTEDTVFSAAPAFIEAVEAQHLHERLYRKQNGQYANFCHQIQSVLRQEILENA